MNSILPTTVLKRSSQPDFFIYEEQIWGHEVRKVEEVLKHGMISIPDTSGTNIDANFDTAKTLGNSSFLKPN
jgi:hypothetical protein